MLGAAANITSDTNRKGSGVASSICRALVASKPGFPQIAKAAGGEAVFFDLCGFEIWRFQILRLSGGGAVARPIKLGCVTVFRSTI